MARRNTAPLSAPPQNDSNSDGHLVLYAQILAAVAVVAFLGYQTMRDSITRRLNGVDNSILYHTFQLLPDGKSEKPGFGMYTYVILPRHVEARDSTNDSLTQRYASLLHAISSSTEGPNAPTIDPAHTDMFCIPAISSDGDPDLNNYNYILAMRYRDYALHLLENHKSFQNKLSVQFGPFLISTQDPLMQLKAGGQMLLADLSSTNIAAFDEVVSAYKLRLQNGPIGTAEVFKPLRLALLSLIEDANQNVLSVKAAYAQFSPDTEQSRPKDNR